MAHAGVGSSSRTRAAESSPASTARDPAKRITRSTSALAGGLGFGAALPPFGATTTTPATSQTPLVPPPSPVRPPSPSAQSWSLVHDEAESFIYTVSAPTHERKLAQTASWLHGWEHARALHAGLRQADVSWVRYPYKPVPDLKGMLDYHAELGVRLERPRESLYTEVPLTESLPELQAAFRLGAIHFMGELALDVSTNLPVFKLCPASAGLGSHLYRKYGSDRFLRIKLDDKCSRGGAPFGGDSRAAKLAQSLKDFLGHPLRIFGRQYRPFCAKDGAIVYWCESGHGLTTVPLVTFAERYIESSLNSDMSVAKWVARFELGRTTTIPTVTFARSQVLRTPDLLNDSLTISLSAMVQICALFQGDSQSDEYLPEGYVPSAIRGSYWAAGAKSERVDMVWRLDCSSTRPVNAVAIQARPLGPDRCKPATLTFSFTLKTKDGGAVSTQYRARGCDIEWVEEEAPVPSGVCMTDGCSISHAGGTSGAHSRQGEGEVGRALPVAAQGRIGGGKGVWQLAPVALPWGETNRFIEIRDSQWKFNDRQTATFQFELHSVPSAKTSSTLGKQTFEVLAHCGVPSSVFRQLLRAHLDEVADHFFDWSDLPAVLYNIEKNTSCLDDRMQKARLNGNPGSVKVDTDTVSSGDDAFVRDGRLDGSSGAPNTIAELVVELLQAGFDPDGSHAHSSPLLAAKLAWMAEDHVRSNVSFRLTSEQARTALVVADPLGVLEEGELYFQSSQPLLTGSRTSHVVLGDVLITRPPAVQPCDIQKMTAVFRPEYAAVSDLIILSAKGTRPACSILSGGDYDGDKLLLLTDPFIVTAFDPSRADPKFADQPFADEEYFDVDRRRVQDIILPLVKAKDSSTLAAHLIAGFFADVKYGMLSKLHTKLAYTLGFDHVETSTVGHLFARALDGKKAGLSIPEEKWALIQKRFRSSDPAPEWTAYEEKIDGEIAATRFAVRSKDLGRHVMDELLSEGRSALKRAKGVYRTRAEGWIAVVDDHLAGLWRRSWTIARERQQHSGNDPFFADLSRIRSHVTVVFEQYKTMRAAWSRAKERRAQTDKASNAPGSPSKSPTKGAWKSSSSEQKQDLLDCAKGFWSILDDEQGFRSPELRGVRGAETTRALIASCAYIEPLEPSSVVLPPPTSSAPKTLLDRLKSTSPVKVPATPPTSTASTCTLAATTVPQRTTVEEEEDEEDEFGFSQLPSRVPYTQLAEEELAARSPSSRSYTAPVLTTGAPTRAWSNSFYEAGRGSKTTFAFDMAHRDVLALKADALAMEVHGGARSAKGIQARKFAPDMADTVSINRRLAGISRSHARVRPRTLLPESVEEGRPSPKKAKTV